MTFNARSVTVTAMLSFILLLSTTTAMVGVYDTTASSDVIAFDANPGGGTRNIYTMNIDGSAVTQLTSGTDHYQEPAISPDGTRIAYIRQAPDFSYAHVWMMDIDGTNQVQLTTHDPGGSNFYSNPTWSPDGTKLAFARYGAGFGSIDVWVMNIDGTGLDNLTDDHSYDQSNPSWSPDGTKIVYFHTGFGESYQIYTMNADGTSKFRVSDGNYVWANPSWSPDGTKILTQYFNWDTFENGISIVNSDGTGRTQIYSGNTRTPVFSTDGTKIIFSKDDGNWAPVPGYQTFNIHIINADGSGDTVLTSDVYDEMNPHMRQISLITPSTIEVDIDIKPGSHPNSINTKSKGKIPVAILSTEDFDAPNEVDTSSLAFGSTGDEDSLAFCNKSAEDVNRDGLLDLVCHFRTQDTGFQVDDTEGILKGQTIGGTPIEGKDSVRIVK